jgi:hypothetical protein
MAQLHGLQPAQPASGADAPAAKRKTSVAPFAPVNKRGKA